MEEDDRIAEPLGWALASEKMEVVFANTGVQGIRAAEHASFDVCVIDHRLPDMCGLQVIRRLRDVGILVPFILMMTCATVEAVVRAMQLGAANVLEKPIDIGGLLTAIRAALPRSDEARIPAPALETFRADAQSGASAAEAGAGQARALSRSSAERWALLVLKAVDAPEDPRTVEHWAQAANVSRSVLAEACRLVHVTAHDARDFARILRVVVRSGGAWRPDELLDVADARTLRKMEVRAGLANATETPPIEEFLRLQQWIPADDPGLLALRALLKHRVI